MSEKFIIQPHFRLQEWVAEEKYHPTMDTRRRGPGERLGSRAYGEAIVAPPAA